ncbi:MAG: NAD-dependent epimerase/dehydratase family protein [Actinomycetota bacterium]
MEQRVLVVGGAGYVGAVLLPELLAQGYAVKVVDRMFFGDHGLADVADRIELVVADVRTMDASMLEGVGAVINLGGLSNDPTAEFNPRANYEMNYLAAERLARLCRQAGVPRMILASSCSIYDVGLGDERRDLVFEEDAPVAPKAAYSHSKFLAEQAVLDLADAEFCPVVLRKGTVYGFSPRMRYDLVVNTMVKSALSRGRMTIFAGGEMWRPLVDVRDAARAYVASLQAPADVVRGEIFNVVARNFRISEVALRVRTGLREAGIEAAIEADYRYQGVRSYRVSGEKLATVLDVRPQVTIEESTADMVGRIEHAGLTDFDHPRYSNIEWMKLLEQAERIVGVTGSVFDAPGFEAEQEAIDKIPSIGRRVS